MKFTCYKNDLLEALQIVIRSVAVKPMTPILSGIYMKADNRSLELQANNFSTGVIVKIPINTEIEGEAVLTGKKFLEFIRNMPDETITLFGEDAANIFSIESGGAHVDLLTMPAVEFPKVRTPDTFGNFRISSTALKSLIRKTVFAVSKDDDRPVFKGCCFEIVGNQLTLVATNTHRISIAKEFIRCDETEHGSFVVPPETLRGLIQYFDPNDVENYVEVNFSDRFVTFKFDNIYLTSRVIDGEFPPYDRIIPSDAITRVEVNKIEFRTAVDFVALVARESEYHMVTFDIVPGHMEISADSPDVGEANKTIEADVMGDSVKISFNVDYILDALRTMDTQRTQICLNGRYDPILIRERDNENYSYVVTPVRA